MSWVTKSQHALDTRPHWYPTDRLWSQGRPCSWAAFPRRQQSQHIFVVLVSQVLVNKESHTPWSFAMLMPVLHMLSSSTATQHCSCTIMHVGDPEIRGRDVQSWLSMPRFWPSLQQSSIDICSTTWPRRAPNMEQSSTAPGPIEAKILK